MTYLNLLLTFSKIGILGFGGGLAIIQIIYDSIQQFSAITPEQFANMVAIAQVTPGPVAVNTATFVGYETKGTLGAIIATLGVSIPSFVLITIVSKTVEKYRESRAVEGALAGVRPASLGLIAAAVLTIGIPAIFAEHGLGANLGLAGGIGSSALSGTILANGLDPLSLVICVATALAIDKFKMDPFKVLLVMAAVGAILGV